MDYIEIHTLYPIQYPTYSTLEHVHHANLACHQIQNKQMLLRHHGDVKNNVDEVDKLISLGKR